MSVFLTAAQDVPVIEKVWNLIDWMIVECNLPVGAIAAASVLGAALCMVIPYLFGSISPAILISQRVCGTDIRTVGRKTAGTYNMLISLGSKMALVSALCEFFVAYISVWFGRIVWGANGAGLALFFVVLGNLFPIFYRLSGGKGIATMIGAAAALHPVVAALLIVVFVISVFATKLVAFGSVAISLLYPLFIKAFANEGLQLAMAVFVTFFVLFAHRQNFRRVQDGKEEKFYFSDYLKKKKAEAEDDDK